LISTSLPLVILPLTSPSTLLFYKPRLSRQTILIKAPHTLHIEMRSSIVFVALASLAATVMAVDLPNHVNATTSAVSPPVETPSMESPYGSDSPSLSSPTGYPSVTVSPHPTGATNGTNNTASHTPTVAPEGAGATFGPAGMLGLAVAGVAVFAGAAIF